MAADDGVPGPAHLPLADEVEPHGLRRGDLAQVLLLPLALEDRLQLRFPVVEVFQRLLPSLRGEATAALADG